MSWMTIIAIIAAGAATAAAVAAYAQRAPSGQPATSNGPAMAPAHVPAMLSAAEAHAKASRREIVLVDVRTPQEWQQTGMPASAHAVTMHQDGAAMLAALDKLLGNDRSKPLAIICRTGNRTAMLQAQLAQVGFTNVFNVAEGVAGSRHGVGWLKAGLPVRPGAAPGNPVIAAQ